MHLTQSVIPRGQSSTAAAEVVLRALAEQPDGVFTALESVAIADKPAMTYRETRPGRHVDWTLLLDDDVRIAIGCQATESVPAPTAECMHAIGTARRIR